MFKSESKEEIHKYLKSFSAISIKNVCIDLGLEKDYQNIMNGATSLDKMKKVKKEVEKRLKKIFEIERG